MTNLKRFCVLGVLLCISGIFSGILNAAEGFVWEKDFNTAVERAAANNQLVLIHFYGDHCPPCKRMEKDIFSRSDVYQTLVDYFVPIKVDTNQNANAVKKLEIVSIPTDIIATPEGKIIFRRVGGTTRERYLNEILAVAEQYYQEQLQQRQLQQQTAQQQTESTALPDELSDVAFPFLDSFEDQYYLLSQDADPYQMVIPSIETLSEIEPTVIQTGSIGSPSSVVTQAYHGTTSTTSGAVTPSASPHLSAIPTPEHVPASPAPTPPVNPPFATNTINTVVPPSIPGSPNQAALQPYLQPNLQPNTLVASNAGPTSIQQYVQPHGTEQVQMQGNDPNTHSVIVANTADYQPDTPNPAVMFEGYCPVALQDHKQWVAGISEWTLHYEGAYFVFSGKEAMQTFAKNPRRYIPILFGNDVVATVREQKRIPGVRKFGGWFQDRIYLFSSQENYNRFVENPAYYANVAEKLVPNQGTR